MSDEYCQIEGCGLEAYVVIRRTQDDSVVAAACEECLIDGSATDRWDGSAQTLLFVARAHLGIENRNLSFI